VLRSWEDLEGMLTLKAFADNASAIRGTDSLMIVMSMHSADTCIMQSTSLYNHCSKHQQISANYLLKSATIYML